MRALAPCSSIRSAIVLAVTLLPAAIGHAPASFAAETIKTVIVDNFPPWSFVNGDGQADGFGVELARAAAESMGFELEVGVDTEQGAVTALREGRIDMLPLLAFTLERHHEFDFSVAHTIAHDAYFSRRGVRVSAVADLHGRKVAVIQGDRAQDFLERLPRDLQPTLVFRHDALGVLRALAAGEADVALLPKVVGHVVATDHGLATLDPDPPVCEAYTRPLSFAVRGGNHDLLERLSQGLLLLRENGEYRRIHQKWFGAAELQGVPHEVVRKRLWLLSGGFLLVAGGILLWSTTLRRRVETRFRALFDGSREAVGIIREGRLLFANRACRDLFGLSPDSSLKNQLVTTLIAPSHRAQIEENLRRRAAGEQVLARYETRGVRADGSEFDLEVRVSTYPERGALHTLAFIRDITEEKRESAARLEAEEILRRSEEKFAKTFELAPVLMTISSVEDGRYLDVNRKFLEISGFSRDEVVGRTSIELGWIGPADRQRLVETLQRDGHVHRMELTLYSRSGRPVECVYHGELIEIGNARCLLSIALDVTEQKHAGESLREAERKATAMLQAMPDLVFRLDREGRILSYKAEEEDLYARPAQGLVGRLVREIFPPEFATLVGEMILRTLESRELQQFEYSLPMPGRGVCDYEARMVRSGEIEVIAIVRDITDRHNAERALFESRRRLELALKSAGMGVWSLELPDGSRTFDTRSCHLLGLDPALRSVSAGQFLAVIHPEDRSRISAAMTQTITIGAPYRTDYRIVLPDGKIRHLAASGSLVLDESGTARVDGLLWDVSERERLEEQLRQAQKMEAIGQLAGGVAHDFNNILNVILGYGELLRPKLAHDAPGTAFLTEVVNAGRRAVDLTRSLLAYSRKQVLARQPLGLNSTIGGIAQLVRRTIGEDVELRLELHPRELIVNADRSHLEQVLLNLATNARDAMPEGGILTITTCEEVGPNDLIAGETVPAGRYAVISVADSGCGMSDRVRERIFDPFFTTKDVGRGTGLGLAMCYGIVNQHNGFMRLNSTEGAGTIFEVLLPLVDDGSEEAALPDAFPDAGVRRGTATILIAEDESQLNSLLVLHLRAAGYRVLAAADGDAALELFEKHAGEIHLAVMDVIMPGRSGTEVLKAMRARRPGLPAIFISGYPADLLERKGIGDEAFTLLRKPVNREDLITAVCQALAATSAC